jgi:hypothetical protein
LAVSGDLNTGIYSPGADQVAISTNGTGRLFVDAAGTVTIPQRFILGPANNVGGLSETTLAAAGVFNTSRLLDGGTNPYLQTGAEAGIVYFNADGTSVPATAFRVAGTERMRLDSSGRLGLGTSTPSAPIEIAAANSAGASTVARLRHDNGADQHYFDITVNADTDTVKLISSGSANGSIILGTQAVDTLTTTPVGNVGIGTSSPVARLQVNAPSASRQYTSSVLDFSNIHLDGATSSSATSALTFSSGGGGGAAVAFSRGSSVETYIGFWTNAAGGVNAATERMRIDNGGNVGIGTSNPAVNLEVASATPTVRISATGGGTPALSLFSAGVYNWSIQGGTALTFTQDATERARIDSGGRLLVGTSSARLISSAFLGGGGANAELEVEGTALAMGSFASNRNDSFGPYLALVKSRGTTAGSFTLVSDGDGIGALSFNGTDGSAALVGAAISAFVDGTPGANDMPGRLVFSTTADGAASPTERMRITNNGEILTNTTSPYSVSLCTTDFNSASQFGLTLRDTGSAIDANMMYFYKSGNVRGNITTTATATSFNTSSDYRLKQDVVPIENASSRVQQLRPVNFAWAETGSRCDGFLAHEAQAVVPQSVTGEKDAVDADGNPVYQGIDQSKLVPLLTAALQEAIAKIETLEARLTAAGID